MSKNITIKEDGVSQDLSLDVLRLPASGGGTVDFVPDGNLGLVKIRVKQNGTYKASDFGAYGISEVSVACTVSGGSATSEADSKPVSGKQKVDPTEGGKQYVFSVKRLSTVLTAGGICKWIQKAAVALGLKNIYLDNKTYKASDDGYYGYSQCTVSGISVTRSTDGDGNTIITHTDGGGTVSIVVPDSIVIDTPPTITNYADGAAIDFSGMVVKAYKADGTLWTDESHPGGVIPVSELILPVTFADASQISGGMVAESDIVDGEVPCTTFLRCVQHNAHGDVTYTYTEGIFAVRAGYRKTDFLFASASPDAECLERFRYVPTDSQGGNPYEHNYHIQVNTSYTHNGQTVYYVGWGQLWDYDEISIGNAPALDGPVAWTMIYGTITMGNIQDIPVQWVRPGDYNTLEANFNITVVPSNYAGATGGGGQAGETGAGRND